MPELTSTLNGVDRNKKIVACAVDLMAGTCSVKTEIVLGWTSGADSKCLSTSYEDVEIPLADLPDLESALAGALEIIYKKIGEVDDVYVATKVVEAPPEEVKP